MEGSGLAPIMSATGAEVGISVVSSISSMGEDVGPGDGEGKTVSLKVGEGVS